MKHQLPLHRIQQKFWTDCLLKDNDIDYNDPNTTFVVEGELDLTTLKEAYRLIMKEYPPLCQSRLANFFQFLLRRREREVRLGRIA